MHRSVRVAALIWTLGSTAIVSQGLASANTFGVRYYSTSQEFGDISSVEVPSNFQQPPNANTYYAQRVLVQPSFSGSPGLIQSGWETAGNNEDTDCGTQGSYTYQFVERQKVSDSSYECWTYSQGTWPTDINFNVYDTTNGWNVKINGNVVADGPFHPGFATGYPSIGGEAQSQNGATAQSETCYGEGPSPWAYYTSEGDGGSGSVTVAHNSDTSTVITGNWSIDPAPSPICDSLNE